MYVIHKSDLTYNNYLKTIKDTRKQGAQKCMKLTFTTQIFKIFALLSFMNCQSLSSFIFHVKLETRRVSKRCKSKYN